jgi:hypothetical protein
MVGEVGHPNQDVEERRTWEWLDERQQKSEPETVGGCVYLLHGQTVGPELPLRQAEGSSEE